MNILNYNIGSYPHLSGTGKSVFMAVLTKRQAQDYACYGAIVDLPDYEETNPDLYELAKKEASVRVSMYGHKLPYDEAQRHFPAIRKENYRE